MHSLPSLSLQYNSISANYLLYYPLGSVSQRGGGKGVWELGKKQKKTKSFMLGTDPYRWIHCHSIPS